MTENQGQIVYRSLHAPKENGAALVEPAIEAFAAQVSHFYQNQPAGSRVCWTAKDFVENKLIARHELFKLIGLEPDAIDQPIVLVGHQPQLFHPGVWMKNFVAARVALLAQGFQGKSGIAVNLVVDNDVMKSASIIVPTHESDGATAQVAFDSPNDEAPYEERRLENEGIAETFANRVAAAMSLQKAMPLQKEASLLDSFWREVLANSPYDKGWGALFSQARSAVEKHWGRSLFDVSVSRIANTHAFARLALELMRDAQAFAEIYNAALAEYRQVHGLRSRSHPAPDLEIVSEQEVEIPFWLWTKASPRRKRTFVRRRGSTFCVTDREGLEWAGDLEEGNELETRLLAQVLSPSDSPARLKLRPKGLITTLFARAFLCDGFVHGIGGYKYDQVTEAIAARWGLGTLAPMQCATMTLRLPLLMDVISEAQVRSSKRKLRELVYHPEKFLAEAKLDAKEQSRAKELVAQKRQWLDRRRPHELRERHQAITSINAELAAMLSEVRTLSEIESKEISARFAAQQPWLSREFAAVLFPEEMLQCEFARVVGA